MNLFRAQQAATSGPLRGKPMAANPSGDAMRFLSSSFILHPSSFLLRPSSFVLSLVLALAAAEVSWGQGSSSGMFGSRTMGQGISSTGFGLDLGSGSGSGTNTVGQITGSERFLQQNRQPGQFVGGSAQNAMSIMSQFNATSTSLLNPTQGLQQLQFGAMDQQPVAPTTIPFRASLSVDFDHPSLNSTAVLGNLAKRLGTTHGLKSRKPIQVVVEGSTAVLQGEVETEHDRSLAEQVARLEPGVWAVRNELNVARPTPGRSGDRSAVRRSPDPNSPPSLGNPSPRGL